MMVNGVDTVTCSRTCQVGGVELGRLRESDAVRELEPGPPNAKTTNAGLPDRAIHKFSMELLMIQIQIVHSFNTYSCHT